MASHVDISRRLFCLSRRSRSEINITAAEEGRKRSLVLPSLVKELTFHRLPRRQLVRRLYTADEGLSNHRERSFCRISYEVNSKVVRHLKYQLYKRTGRCCAIAARALPGVGSDQEKTTAATGAADKDFVKVDNSSEQKRITERKTTSSNRIPKTPPPISGSRYDLSLDQFLNLADSFCRREPDSVTGKPRVPETPGKLEGKPSDGAANGVPLSAIGGAESDSFQDESRAPDGSQTPPPPSLQLRRRETTEMENSSTMGTLNARVLRGDVGISPPGDSSVSRVYICSNFTDTKAERTALIEDTYPRLKEFYLERKREVEIYDLHWGCDDPCVDDHCLPDIFLETIDRCLHSNARFNFIIFMGQKYGPFILPTKIPAEEFEVLMAAAELEQKKMIDHLQRRSSFVLPPGPEVRGNDPSLVRGVAGRENNSRSLVGNPSCQGGRGQREAEGAGGLSLAPPKENHPEANAQRRKSLQWLWKGNGKYRDVPDPDLMAEWYQLDGNRIPPAYCLQKISSQYKEILRNDATKRRFAKQSWSATAGRLQQMLQKLVNDANFDPSAKRKYFTTVFHDEIVEGTKNSRQALCFSRTISQLTPLTADPSTRDFLDLDPNRPILDENMTKFLLDTRDRLIPSKLPSKNIFEHQVEWGESGIRPAANREHAMHVDRLTKQVFTALADEPGEREPSSPLADLEEEVAFHVRTCHERARNFHGHEDILEAMRSNVCSPFRRPLIVHGKPGIGKTSLLAKAAIETPRWLNRQGVSVIVRLIGSSNLSSTVHSLLRTLCLQLCQIFNSDPQQIPMDEKGLGNYFIYCLSLASADAPVVIYLDAVNELTDEINKHNFYWIPQELPPHTLLILSSGEDESNCLGNLRNLFLDEGNFLEVPSLRECEATALFTCWLRERSRKLTPAQMNVVLEAFRKCPTPLFLEMAFRDAIVWTSHLKEDQTKLAGTVRKVVVVKFGMLEKVHGEAVVRRALGYITVSRRGITSNEMEDLLSLDEAVMDEVATYHSLPCRRLPTILWVRLLHDLRGYLTEHRADNTRTLRWSHTEITASASERYIDQRDKAPSYHKALGEYFLGIWADKRKPHAGNEVGEKRFVAKQRLYAESPQFGRVYNARKINELPYHLLKSHQVDALKSNALCNFEWVLAKLCGTTFHALMEEYRAALSADPNDLELKLLSDALQLSSRALIRYPNQLASQVTGRLQRIITDDVPATSTDPKRYPHLHQFLAQVGKSSVPALVPSVSCLAEPGDVFFDLLSGHTAAVTALELMSGGELVLTSSLDDTMKMWKLSSGQVIKTINGVGAEVRMLTSGMDNLCAVTSEVGCMRIWSLGNGCCQFVIRDCVDSAVITTAANGRLLVALFDGSNILRAWDLKDNFKLIQNIEIDGDSIHKDRSLVVSKKSKSDRLLYAHRDSDYATYQNVRSGSVVHSLACNEKSSAIVALATTRHYLILACRQNYTKLQEIHQLELFHPQSGMYLRSIRGCTRDNINEVTVNMGESHAITVCTSEQNHTSDITVWNLETEEHKHLAKHTLISTMCACRDFRYCLTGAKGESSIRIWDLRSKISQTIPKLKKATGIESIICMTDNPRYVVGKGINNGSISVWNVAKAKRMKTAVRVEQGIIGVSDIVLVRNTKVVILSDRGFSNVSEELKPVFQTIFIYDLRLKKFQRKLTGCYIDPAPQHEFALLEDDKLMGLSDSRSHFIIWSLVSGQVMHRIKTVFKELGWKMPQCDLSEGSPAKMTRGTTAKMMPWDRRSETKTARMRRHQRELEAENRKQEELEREKQNSIDQYIISGDGKTIVASFFAHHLCVFEIGTNSHVQTLESRRSMMLLHVAALTHDGSNFVHASYDDDAKVSYVTLWECTRGKIKRRLRKEKNVSALAIADDSSRVVIGKGNNELHIWDPLTPKSLKKIKGCACMHFDCRSKIFMTEGKRKAVIFAGDISLWDIEAGTMLAAFTPDMRIQCCNVAMNGKAVVFGLLETANVVVLKLMHAGEDPVTDDGEDMFGEPSGDSSDDDTGN